MYQVRSRWKALVRICDIYLAAPTAFAAKVEKLALSLSLWIAERGVSRSNLATDKLDIDWR